MSYETITRVFPDRRILWGFGSGSQWLNEVAEANGREQRRQRYINPRALLTGSTEYLSPSDRQVIGDFMGTVSGTLIPFYLFAWATRKYLAFNVGTGTGAATTFTLPFGNPLGATFYPSGATTLQQAYDGGSPVSATIQVGTGTYGEDKIVYGSAPANNHALTADITGRPRPGVRFSSDQQLEAFVQSAVILTTRNLSCLQVDQDAYNFIL